MTNNNHSPIPSEEKIEVKETNVYRVDQMTFPEAIKKVIEGQAITRLSWGDNGHYGMLKNNILCLFRDGKDGDTFYSWIVNDGDLLATDWVVTQVLN